MRATCFALAAFFCLETTGCGLDDGAQVSCRCTDETNLADFPDCVAGTRPTPDNPFTTQLPDCPSGQLLILAEQTEPANVLENVRTVFEARPQTRNVNQYMDQLAEDFNFVPDAGDIALHPEVYDVRRDTLWNRELERRFAAAILDPSVVHEVRFKRWYQSSKDQRIVSDDGLRESFVFPYRVLFTNRLDESGRIDSLIIKGLAEISCVKSTFQISSWAIQEWVDVRDLESANRSWGEIRADFLR